MTAAELTTSIGIGGMTVRLHSSDPEYQRVIGRRYAGFPGSAHRAGYDFDVELFEPHQFPQDGVAPDADASVTCEGRRWRLQRGDFRAEWDPAARRGRIRQTLNPYSLDSMLRIVHTLVLARQGGVLMHAASAVRNGKAYLFAGLSGAGKTTISRLAPPDATLLSDEISYLRLEEDGYHAYGTPFAGELGKPGENVRAPLAAIYLLGQGPENRIEAVPVAEAARALLANILFFANEPELVQAVFRTACHIAEHVPVQRLTFFPDERVWELIPGAVQ